MELEDRKVRTWEQLSDAACRAWRAQPSPPHVPHTPLWWGFLLLGSLGKALRSARLGPVQGAMGLSWGGGQEARGEGTVQKQSVPPAASQQGSGGATGAGGRLEDESVFHSGKRGDSVCRRRGSG